MIGKVEVVKKETVDIWRRIIKNDTLYRNVVKSSQPEVKGVSDDQRDETQTKGHLEVQGNTTVDAETSDNPSVADSSTVPKIQNDDNAPSGNTGAQDKGDGAEKEPEKEKVKDAEVDKEKGVVDLAIETPPVTRTPPQISINLDGLLNLGQISPIKNIMLAVVVQAQASQDLVKSEFEDKNLILMSVNVLQKVALSVQLDPNYIPFGKLLQLINNVDTNFDSLEKPTNK